MLFFAFLVCIIPISFAEEDSKKIQWEKATLDSKYFIHFQAQTRNANGSLVSVIETFHTEYLSDSRTELVYSQLPLKQVEEISNQTYEVKQLEHIQKVTVTHLLHLGAYNLGYEKDGWRIPCKE